MRPKQKLMDPYDYFSSRIGIFLLVFVFFLAQELRAQRQTSLLPKRKKQDLAMARTRSARNRAVEGEAPSHQGATSPYAQTVPPTHTTLSSHHVQQLSHEEVVS